jgi:hypothetical protein
MLAYASQVSWILIAAFALSALYELYRSTAKAGTSKYDSMRSFLTQALPFYAFGFLVALLLSAPSDREELPVAVEPLQQVHAAVFEGDVGPGDQIPDGP